MIKNKPSKEDLYGQYILDEQSTYEIAEVYKCDSSTISAWLLDYDICIRNKKECQNTSQALKAKKERMMGDKNPSKRPEIRKKMSKPRYMNDSIKRKEFTDGLSNRMKETHYEAGSDSALKQGISISGENNPMKRYENCVALSCSNRGIPIEEFEGFECNEVDEFYNSQKYQDWRGQVFYRDNYKCQECGSVVDIQSHHILPRRDWSDIRFSLNIKNGITLCKNCHYKTYRREYEFFNKYFDIANGVV